MESFEKARKAHDDFQEARQMALDDLLAQRKAIDERIREVQGFGKAQPAEATKKRGRPRKDEKKEGAAA